MKGVLWIAGIFLISTPLHVTADSCKGQALGTHVPHESNCALFYFCDGNGNGVVNSCVDGYYFDPLMRFCRPSALVACGSSGSPTAAPTPAPTAAPTPAPTAASTPAPTAAPTPAPTAAPTPAPTAAPTPAPTAAPTPAPTAAPTPAPTAAPTPAPTATPTAAPTAGPPSGGFTGNECKAPNVSHGDLLPYPGDCTRFIHCSYGVAHVKNCPSTLHFNKASNTCDWPAAAGCAS